MTIEYNRINRKKILHLASLDKFIPSFINIVSSNFAEEDHVFLTFGDLEKYNYKQTAVAKNYKTFKSPRLFFNLVLLMHSSDRIVLHGLFMQWLTILLILMPWLNKKCFWVIWGGDLYCRQASVKNVRFRLMEFFRGILIPRLGGFITYVDGDYQKVKEWYGAKGKLLECIVYESNIFSGRRLSAVDFKDKNCKPSRKLNLLVGNSADPSNNHQQIFEKLKRLDVENCVSRIYCPLSYGCVEHAERVKNLGESIFGDRFVPLMDFISLEKYNEILEEIDIAVFAHDRQQGMGNAINLLGRGKTVFMRPDTTSFDVFNKIGVTVFDVESLGFYTLDVDAALNNHKRICEYFSRSNLINQLKEVFKC